MPQAQGRHAAGHCQPLQYGSRGPAGGRRCAARPAGGGSRRRPAHPGADGQGQEDPGRSESARRHQGFRRSGGGCGKLHRMSYLRSLLFFAILFVVTPVFTTLQIVLCFGMPHRWRRMSVAPWVAFTNFLVKHLLGIKYELRGAENIPQGRPVVVMCKHQSAWETLALQEIFPSILFVWKKELKLIPFFGWALAVTPSISIDRSAGKEAMKSLVD